MDELLSNPAIIDQMIQSSPQLRALGPQARQIMQSPMFRQMMTNPDVMRQAMQMQQTMQGGGSNAAPQPGLFGLAQQQQQQNALGQLGGATASSGPTVASPTAQAGSNPWAALLGGAGGANPLAAGGNPFAGFGNGAAGGAPDLAQLQNLFGAGSPFGSWNNPPAAAPADPRPPEERFEVRWRLLIEAKLTIGLDSIGQFARNGLLQRDSERSSSHGNGRQRRSSHRVSLLQPDVKGHVQYKSACVVSWKLALQLKVHCSRVHRLISEMLGMNADNELV